MKRLLSLIPFLALLACGGPSDRAYLKVGTGSQTGVYYAAGLALAELVNGQTSTHKVDLSVESTDGSVFNINAVMQGQMDFGFAQADRQYQAGRGLGPWEGTPQSALRFVCSFHTEAVTLVAADDSGIELLSDVRDTTTSIGSPASGTRGNATELLAQVGLTPEIDFNAEGLKASEASMMLQDGRIDAFFYTVGHPNGALLEATNGKRTVHFVPIVGMDTLLKASPYYHAVEIPKHFYPKATHVGNTPTIGMRTVLVTTTDLPDEAVYGVVKSLFEQFEAFKERHPSFATLTPQSMVKGATIPMHPGAERYYREQGWL